MRLNNPASVVKEPAHSMPIVRAFPTPQPCAIVLTIAHDKI